MGFAQQSRLANRMGWLEEELAKEADDVTAFDRGLITVTVLIPNLAVFSAVPGHGISNFCSKTRFVSCF